mmetsp:Transcript_89954/g.140889  ORF Transcript_89954/g.140889 Transcript_89954/m.140889 type:complete len:888 (+) Transcript_89954:66-2729(+)
MVSWLSPIFEFATDVFNYNHTNFNEDREQRQECEYKVMDMRVEQAGLWREDIREIVEFTQTKLEMYMLVSTLELGFCATAIVKAVVVSGTPLWLAVAHTLMLCGAFMFLLISMLLGINGYVSSQAYQVRLLTQYVRLPIPEWKHIEASRNYSSNFEKLKAQQMFRIPFLTGSQERWSTSRRSDAQDDVVSPRIEGRQVPASPKLPNDIQSDSAPSDPWGLERRGDDIAELQPDVNDQCAKQNHIWLMREAGKYYLTYEAFCRVAMSLGTSYLSLFFAYYCLTYCLVEDGSPIAAYTGMTIFVVLSLVVVYLDRVANLIEMTMLALLQTVAPVLSAITIYVSAPDGYGGIWEYLVCIGLVGQGLWLLLYLYLLRVRETDTGVFFPMAFKTSLLLDTFGRHGHPSRPSQIKRQSTKKGGSPNASLDEPREGKLDLPAMHFFDGPLRPEDLKPFDGQVRGWGSEDRKQTNRWRPDTFFGEAEEDGDEGSVSYGAKPGSQVWVVFRNVVILLALSWWIGAIFSYVQAYHGQAHFVQQISWEDLAENTPIQSVALLTARAWRSERVQTYWPSAMARPQGLACDPEGTQFATFGRGKGGRRALLHSRLEAETNRGSKLVFLTAPLCKALETADNVPLAIQDVALHKCGEKTGCAALVLPKRSRRRLVSCALSGGAEGEELDIISDAAAGLSLFQRQAVYRKISANDTIPNVELVLAKEQLNAKRASRDQLSDDMAAGFLENASVPLASAWLDESIGEELAAVSLTTCPDLDSSVTECPVIATSAGRVVQMMPGRAGDSGEASWVPRRLLADDESKKLVEPGFLTSLAGSHVGALQKMGDKMHILHAGLAKNAPSLKLPRDPTGRPWTAVCAGGGSVFALESGENPAVWRFTPK